MVAVAVVVADRVAVAFVVALAALLAAPVVVLVGRPAYCRASAFGLQ